MDDASYVRRTTCPLDCPDLCALDVSVADGRIVALDGAPDHPVTRGYICGKVRRFADHVYGPERLLAPARRIGPKGEGRFETITWDEALETIERQIRRTLDRHGGEAILPFCYGGSNGKFTQDAFDARFFRRLGASRLARTVCAAPTGRVLGELYGKMPGTAYPDYTQARLIVLWGVNPQTSGIHLMPFLKEARRAGAKTVVVDPRSTPLARQADLHLPVRPGSDVAVALSVLRWFWETGRADERFLAEHATGADELRRRAAGWTFERAGEAAGVDPRTIERFAQLYADSSPAVVRCGWGLERTRSAGSNVAAVLALPAVAGKFGVRGGGFTMSNSGAWKFRADEAIAEPPSTTRLINMNRLGRALTEERAPPVELLFVYNANPVSTVPHQELVRAGLRRDDLFTVVHDQVLTDTGLYADLLLPATTFLEHHDYRAGYGVGELRHVAPVVPPVGQSRPNDELFAELLRRFQLDRPDDPVDRDAWLRRFLGTDPDGTALYERLTETGAAEPPGGLRPVQFVDVFPGTPDRKIHLCPEKLDAEAPSGLYAHLSFPPDPQHPLQMISPATEHLVNSTLGQLWRQIVPLELHPADAAARQIADGDRVRVYNRQAEVLTVARLSHETRPGLVVLPKGLWARHTLNGATSNALAPDELTDVAGGACFNDTWVEVERAAE